MYTSLKLAVLQGGLAWKDLSAEVDGRPVQFRDLLNSSITLYESGSAGGLVVRKGMRFRSVARKQVRLNGIHPQPAPLGWPYSHTTAEATSA